MLADNSINQSASFKKLMYSVIGDSDYRPLNPQTDIRISNIEMAIYPSSNPYGRDERQQSSEIDMLREMNNVIDIVP